MSVLLLTGCASQSSAFEPQPQSQAPSTTPMYWTKANYTQAAFNSDKYQCLQSAITISHRDSPTISTQPYGDMADFIQLSNQNNLFSACMEAKGYTLQTGVVVTPSATLAKPKISNMKMAYCLGVHQSILKSLDKYLQENPDSENAKGTKMAINDENGKLQAIATYLTDVYGTSATPPDILTEIEKGNKDHTKIVEGKKNKYQNCISPCHIDMNKSPEVRIAEYSNCTEKCFVYMSDKERKIIDCFEITNASNSL